MNTFTVPDICDENEDVIIGDFFLKFDNWLLNNNQ